MANTIESIEYLRSEAAFLDEVDLLSAQINKDELQKAAQILTDYRDTLVRIAKCQAGIASHEAQDALAATGVSFV